MKRLLLCIIAVLPVIVACTEECDHLNIDEKKNQDLYEYLDGTWYVESDNEEIRYTKSGTLYDKYCTIKRSEELMGRFEVDQDNMRLTYTYEAMGQMMHADYRISDIKDLSFVISSDKVGSLTLEKVLATYTLEVGESCYLDIFTDAPDFNIISMQCSSRIVAIDKSAQKITATGEKGTAYIKLNTDKGTAWVKIVVGDECLDLWYDYVSFIGKDYHYMTSILGTPSKNGEDGYSFVYSMLMHDLIYEVNFIMNSATGLIDSISLVMTDGVPSALIQSYMDSHYYPNDNLGISNCFMTSPIISESIALVQYDKEQNCVRISDASFYRFPDYTDDLGRTLDEIVAEYGPLYMDELPLYVVLNPFGNSVYFMISETTGKVTVAMFSLVSDVDENEVHKTLSARYNHYKSDENAGMYAYRNAGQEDSTVMVIYNAADGTVTWYDLLNYGK